MFALPFFRRDLPALKGERVTLQAAGARRLPRMGGASARKPRLPRAMGTALGRRRARPRGMAPAASAAIARISRTGIGVAFFIFENADRKAARRHHARQHPPRRRPDPDISATGSASAMPASGLMVEALGLLVPLRLRYAEVAPDRGCLYSRTTQRSIRVLEKAGFQREGLLRSYLRINGSLAGSLSLRPDRGRSARRQDKGLIIGESFTERALAGVCPRGDRRRCARRSAALAVEPIKISRDDVALDLSGAVADLPQPGREFPGFDGARPRRHRAAHRGRGQ